MRRIAITLAKATLCLYFVGAVFISTIIAWRSDSDVRYDTGLLGEFLAGRPSVARGWIWPYLLLTGRPILSPGLNADGNRTPSGPVPPGERQRDSLARFARARSLILDSQEGFQKYLQSGGADRAESAVEAVGRFKAALAATDGIDYAALDDAYPDLGSKFSQTAVAELRLYIQALERADASGLAAALKLGLEWAEWYNPRIAEINDMLKRRLGGQ